MINKDHLPTCLRGQDDIEYDNIVKTPDALITVSYGNVTY